MCASAAAVISYSLGLTDSWIFLLLLPIFLVGSYAYILYHEKYRTIRDLYLQTVDAFANAIDTLEIQETGARSGASGSGKLVRTQAATLTLARALEVDEETYGALEVASMLFDVGMISVPSYILHKPSRLTETEFQKIRTHVEVGEEILSSIEFKTSIASIVRNHHENWDGSGYPDGLKGEEISYGARILSVASCYEALRSPRIYRIRSIDQVEAVTIMQREAHRFDPKIFDKFLENIPQIENELDKLQTAAGQDLRS